MNQKSAKLTKKGLKIPGLSGFLAGRESKRRMGNAGGAGADIPPARKQAEMMESLRRDIMQLRMHAFFHDIDVLEKGSVYDFAEKLFVRISAEQAVAEIMQDKEKQMHGQLEEAMDHRKTVKYKVLVNDRTTCAGLKHSDNMYYAVIRENENNCREAIAVFHSNALANDYADEQNAAVKSK